MGRYSYLFLCVLLLFFEYLESLSLKNACQPCDKVRDLCPPLPVKCEKTRRHCGCCDECTGRFGEVCSARTVRCSTGLLCVNERGEVLETVPWYMSRFQGTCQNVLAFPEVSENTDVDERRHVPWVFTNTVYEEESCSNYQTTIYIWIAQMWKTKTELSSLCRSMLRWK